MAVIARSRADETDVPQVSGRPKAKRDAALDGLRGIAILCVLIHHALSPHISGFGVSGVALFFALSGFLITSLLLKEYDRTGTLSFRKFYTRRALRLLPALFLFILVYLVFSLIFDHGHQRPVAILSSIFAATYTIPIALAGNFDVPLTIASTWSLATEEWYYLVWPALLFFLLRRGFTGRRLFLAVIALTLMSTLLRAATFVGLGAKIYSAPTTWIESLLGGSALAVAHFNGWLRNWRLPRFAGLVVLSLFLGLSSWSGLRTSGLSFGPGLSLLTLLDVALVAVCVTQKSDWFVVGLGKSRIMHWLGQRSYAIYLWNSAFLLAKFTFLHTAWVQDLLGIAATLAISELSWRFVESRYLTRKRDFEVVNDTLASQPYPS
jgi:peptidoglycan/LPS O-acetylase OafA/YrhL